MSLGLPFAEHSSTLRMDLLVMQQTPTGPPQACDAHLETTCYLRSTVRAGQFVAELRNGLARMGFYSTEPAPIIGVGRTRPWYRTKILSEYPVRILEVDRKLVDGGRKVSYNLDPTVTVEKGRFIARYRGSRGRKPSGSIFYGDIEQTVIELRRVFKPEDIGSRAGPLVEFEGDLLPKMITLNAGFANVVEGRDIVVSSYNDHINISGAAGPAPIGWHRFEIVVDGKNKFHAHGLVESLGGAAAFAANIPLSVGRNKIVVSCEDFEPAPMSVVREQPRPSKVDIARDQAGVREYQIKRNSEPARSRSYWDNHFKVLRRKIGMARDYAEIEQFINARAVLQEVAKEIPRGPMPHPSLEDDPADAHKSLMYTLPDICYRLGDAKTMAEAGKWCHDQEIAEQIRDVESGSDPPRYYLYRAKKLADFIERCILLDADSVMGPGFIARLDAQHQDLLKRAGVFDPQYDGKYRFRYGQEVGK